MLKGFVVGLAGVIAAFAPMAQGALTVEEGDGGFRVSRNGATLISSVTVDRGAIGGEDVKSSFATLPDGTKVWNRWSEVRDRRFRLEVAQRADGAIEITMTGQMEAESKVRRRLLCLDFPKAALENRPFTRMLPSAKFWKYGEDHGTFDGRMEAFFTRFLAADGVTYDFNPLGPGDFSGGTIRTDGGNQLNRNGVIGMWMVERTADGFRFSSGDEVPTAWGGYTGGKIVIREGEFADYHSVHLIRSYFYQRQLEPSHLLAFGSPKRGKAYSEGDVPYTAARGYGWMDDRALRVRRAVVGHGEGAYYSALAGEGPDTYRIGGLPNGFYILTLMAGNYAGASNRFSVAVNGEGLLSDATVPVRKFRRVARAVHVRNGRLDLAFSGRWLVSAIGLQPLMGDGEDFSVCRGLWVSDGYEPCTLYRNADYRPEPVFATMDETEEMPVPGRECAAAPHAPPAPVERPAADDPRLEWMKTAKMQRLLDNSVSMSEFDEPGSLDRFMDREFAGKDVRVVMLSGMHSRHTYLGHVERGIEAMRRMCRDLHRRDVKVIDHHDATLLWNEGAGFRVMMERLDETLCSLDTGLPSWQFCASNPRYCETYYAYLRRLVEAGVDGFQIDEMVFWRHGCTCRHCRDAFRRDTGWEIPLNELDAAWNDPKSELRRRWQDWRRKAITNWFVELRRRVKDLRPDLVLSNYTTNDAFYYPFPWRNESTDIQDLGRTVNYFGAEMMTRSAMRNGRNLLPLAKMRSAVSPQGAAPVWTWYYNVDYATDYFAWALSTMVGQTPLLSGIPVPEGGSRYEEFGAGPAAMDLGGAETVAEIALLFPSYSRDWNEGAAYRPGLFGTAQTLEAMHIPYDFISDETLETGRLGKYKVLFVGEAQCLTDGEIASVRAFAAKGGKVLLSPRAGTRDRFGLLRKESPFGEGGAFTFIDIARGAPFELDENWDTKKWNFAPDPAAEAAFRREIEGWARLARDWRIEAPDKVFASVWRERKGTYVVHFLNGTGVDMKVGDAVVPNAPDPAFPPIRSDILIDVPAGVGGKAVAVSPDFEGEVALSSRIGSDGRKRYVLPAGRLTAYTLVRIGRD